MKKFAGTLCLVQLLWSIASAQEPGKFSGEQFDRGKFYGGPGLNSTAGKNGFGGEFISPLFRAGIFIIDKWSVEMAIRSPGISGDRGNKHDLSDVELGFGYWIHLQEHLVLQLNPGIRLTHRHSARSSGELKMGAAIYHVLTDLPRLALHLGAELHIRPEGFKPFPASPRITLGISFFFGKIREKNLSQKIKD